MKRGPKPQALEDKFEVLPNGCWQWLRATIEGYGYTRDYDVDFKQRRAHRVMYERLRGPIPTGLTLDHLCRNRGCVNPDHMEIVTSRENTLRGETVSAINARKTHCVRGHPLAGDNLYLHAGRRHCRTCRHDRKRSA